MFATERKTGRDSMSAVRRAFAAARAAREDPDELVYDGTGFKRVALADGAMAESSSDSEAEEFVLKIENGKISARPRAASDSSSSDDEKAFEGVKLGRDYYARDVRERSWRAAEAAVRGGVPFHVPKPEESVKAVTGRYSKGFQRMAKEVAARALPVVMQGDLMNAYKVPRLDNSGREVGGMPYACALAMGEVPVDKHGNVYIRADVVGKKLGSHYGQAECYLPRGAFVSRASAESVEKGVMDLYLLQKQLETARAKARTGDKLDFNALVKGYLDSVGSSSFSQLRGEIVRPAKVESEKKLEKRFRAEYAQRAQELARLIVETPRFREQLKAAQGNEGAVKTLQTQVAAFADTYTQTAAFCASQNMRTKQADISGQVSSQENPAIACDVVTQGKFKFYRPNLTLQSRALGGDVLGAIEMINRFYAATDDAVEKHPLFKWFKAVKVMVQAHQRALESTDAAAKLFGAKQDDGVDSEAVEQLMSGLKKLFQDVRNPKIGAGRALRRMRRHMEEVPGAEALLE